MGRLLLIPAVLLLLLAGAMLWSGSAADEPADFSFINRGDIRTLDPNRMAWAEDIRVGYAIYEGLYALDPETLEAIPGAAGRIDISPDKTVYTFHIRPEAGWSNGDPVLARDFVFAWRRMLEQPGDYTYLFDYIKGALLYRTAFGEGRPADFGSVGIEELDARILRVTLDYPVPYFPEIVAFPSYFPLNQRAMEPFKGTDPVTGRAIYKRDFMRPPNLVTNGPYRLARWDFKKRLRLIANDHYWDRPNVRSRIIDQVIVEDNKLGEFLRYEHNQVQLLTDVDPEIAGSLMSAARRDPARTRPDLHITPAFGTYFITVNCRERLPDGRPNPFADVRVRRAFAMSIHKDPIVQTITRTGELPAGNFVPPGTLPGYQSPPGIPYDVPAARKLIEQAGYPGGRGFPRITFTYNTGAMHGEVAQMLRRQWREALGIEIELEAVEPAIFSDRLHNKEYQIARAGWFGDYADVSTFTDKYLSTSYNNDSAWINPAYDKLLADAAREPDPQKRLAILAEAEQLLLDEAPILPVYYYVNRSMFRGDIRGVYPNPQNMTMFKAVYVER
jgi:oligopeptide transport system substrate-binding protein